MCEKIFHFHFISLNFHLGFIFIKNYKYNFWLIVANWTFEHKNRGKSLFDSTC